VEKQQSLLVKRLELAMMVNLILARKRKINQKLNLTMIKMKLLSFLTQTKIQIERKKSKSYYPKVMVLVYGKVQNAIIHMMSC
jgi:hypothetical protein